MSLHEDEVVLTLGSDALRITQNYEIKAGVLMQPGGFAIRLGHGGVVAKLLSRYPENTPFSLTVNGRLAQTGFTDGFTTGEGSGASEITFEGRDMMAPICDAYVESERGFENLTYAELTREVIRLAGLVKPNGENDFQITPSNAANRRRMTGTAAVETKPPQVTMRTFTVNSDSFGELVQHKRGAPSPEFFLLGGEEVLQFRDAVPGTSKTFFRAVIIQTATKWYDWLKTQLERAGFFLWASADGNFILSAPNGEQEPSYEIVRTRRGERGPGNVLRGTLRRNIKDRYTKWIVFGKGGGRNFGHGVVSGEFIDRDMQSTMLGRKKVRSHHDAECKTPQQCEFLARRMAAEANRDGWNLTYTVAGHSTEGRRGRTVWAQDTVVAVDDRELGIAGNFYLESLTMNRGPETTTTLRLMRIDDLVFATEAEQST